MSQSTETVITKNNEKDQNVNAEKLDSVNYKGLLEAIARNPQISGKAMVYAILAMALAEATSIYAFVIAFMLMNK